jgi:KDO2-lipid IV(A) lauroyltransferase
VKEHLKKLLWNGAPFLIFIITLPIALMPRRFAIVFGSSIGTLLYYLSGKTRSRAEQNIRNSLPFLENQSFWTERHGTPEQITQRLFANLGKSVIEVIKLYYGLGERLIDSVEFRGLEHFEDAKKDGKGVICITGHCGNWELFALSFGIRAGGLHVVARPQKTEFMTSLIERLRGKFGNRTIYKRGAARRILSILREQGTVGILSDVAVKPHEGVLTPFLGRDAWTSSIPAYIALKNGVPIVPMFIHREGKRHVVDIFPALPLESGDVASVTGTIARSIEHQIARHPDEWLWLYRRWRWAP